jgi:hypothetical protein
MAAARSRRHVTCLWVGLVALIAALAPTAALADDGFLGAVGSGVVPLDNEQVTMDAERVEATLRGDEAWVTCVFTFTNAGPAADVLMGFPELLPDPDGGPSPALNDFTAEVDGESLPVTFREQVTATVEADAAGGAGNCRGWHTFTVPFASGQTRVVTNTYRGQLGHMSDMSQTFHYILASGASWRGPIGDTIVRVQWADQGQVAEILGTRPDGAVEAERSVTWRFGDLEPTEAHNISFVFRSTASATARADHAATENAMTADSATSPTSAVSPSPVVPSVDPTAPAGSSTASYWLIVLGGAVVAAVVLVLYLQRRRR